MLQDKLNKNETRLIQEELTKVFGPVISENITDLHFFYEGYRNKTYKAKYRDKWVQVRIPKSDDNSGIFEEKLASVFKDYLFYKDGFLIKQWHDGQDLTKIKINKTITKNLIYRVKEIHKMKLKVPSFNWYEFKINDPKYDLILKKYSNEDLVFSHNNLKRSNIIVNSLGRVKVIDYDKCFYNHPAVDVVMMHINLGISKDFLCDEFNLSDEEFDDFVYVVKAFEKAAFEQFYSHLDTPLPKISRSLQPFQTKTYNYQSSFIVQKVKDGFSNRLSTEKLNYFYFVPVCVFEDDKIIIWRWMESNSTTFITERKIRSIARAIKILHSSKVDFPPSIIINKMNKYIQRIGNEAIKNDFDSVFINNIKKWIAQFDFSSNCHNSLSLDNIFFSKNQSVFITQWDMASKGDPYLDIATLFENMGWNPEQENIFWKTYDKKCPKDFIKYRIVVQFLAYLTNKLKLDDEFQSRINQKRIKDLIFSLNNQE
ncbi:hypothetical protein [[Mycoplasma] gypis]|uniref:Aminoglycoside phosphotransferase domain-containing protein n=1 Tax=[Mycoplasma] gypis TaxID=92404 RepID=A0ABZ2RTR6_9BACT|nr:hypothetical protein [[Mycoplasma] gypis]MBN0919658.1 hypothetical protein [[Mycoplasma] gypis]